MPKLLHIAQDEKFIEAANKQFQAIFPGSNDFFIVTSNVDNYELKHIKKHSNFRLFKENKENCKYIISQLYKYDLIILHNLDYFKSEIVLNTDKTFLWLYWGFEVYNTHKQLKKKILGSLTLKLQHQLSKVSLISKTKEILFRLRSGRLNMISTLNKATRKIQYFGSGIEEEYDLLKAHNIITANFFYFSYYNLDSYVNGSQFSPEKKNKILLGNSASATNNHLEAMELLDRFKNNELKIIAPLNYGDMQYADEISNTGKKIFGEKFNALTDFIPLDDYNQILNECSIFVMNSYRQQALGNIYTMLFLGAKVYLDERNLAYNFLIRIGIIVFSINEDLKPENKDALEPLNKDQQNTNRLIIEREFGSTFLNDKIKNQLNEIIGN